MESSQQDNIADRAESEKPMEKGCMQIRTKTWLYPSFIFIYAIISSIIIFNSVKNLNDPPSVSPELPCYSVYLSYPTRQAEAAGLSAFLILTLIYFILDFTIFHKWKKWGKTVAVFLSLTLIFAGVEVAMRMAESKFPSLYRPNPVYLWELSPRLKGEYNTLGKPISTNSYGFRMKEISRKKPSGQFRVMTLGDSSAFGYGVNEEETFSLYLEKKLQKKNPGQDIRVINAAVSNYSTFQAMKFMDGKGWKFSPNLLIIAFNDAPQSEWIRDSQRVPPKSIQPVIKILYKSMIYLQSRKIMLNRQIAKYPDIIRQPPADSRVGQSRVSPDELKQHLAVIIMEAKKRGMKVIVLSLPQQVSEDKLSARYRKKMKEAADENGVEFSDLFHQWQNEKTDGLFFDVIHPTSKGNEKIAESLAELITGKK